MLFIVTLKLFLCSQCNFATGLRLILALHMFVPVVKNEMTCSFMLLLEDKTCYTVFVAEFYQIAQILSMILRICNTKFDILDFLLIFN